ncbi:hypothetical protein BKP64_03470 [Marinobacter salinus]|uniref:Uncharacterized protein n=1 Tax=Marinobacter salinus TaxID=1874317 RepID=A0A1D9GI86_9GAMM|nr:hypothetical protein [Marinobacter salinus]AOY87319.1 hypothetical protein BKP64_03470 [Marinobacter salinus]
MLRGLLVPILLSCVCLTAGCDSGGETVERDTGTTEGAAAQDHKESVSLSLSADELEWVGRRIFRNECAGKYRCLVHWNDGEAFPSLGIGHFIWYPRDVDGRFIESFPPLIQYMSEQQVSVPQWLQELDPFDAPWPDKAGFAKEEDSYQVIELREFLATTQGFQAEFIFRRAQAALTRIVMAAPEERREQIREDLASLSSTPGGIYALMDYVNFKGEGLSATEQYHGQGWGLLQVLLAMESASNTTPLEQFRDAAAQILTRRANNAENPVEKERWLEGWLKRLMTYREPDGLNASE